MGIIKRILMFIIALAFFAGAVYLVWQWKQSKSTHSSSTSPTDWENIDPSDSTFTPSADVLNGNLDNIAEPADWKIYKNTKLGFSINLPQRVLGVDKCKNTKFEAPVVVLDDVSSNAIFVVPEYYYDKYNPSATQVKTDSDGITFVEDDPVNTGDPNLSDTDNDGAFDCRKKIYTIPLIKQEISGSSVKISKVPLLGNPVAGISLRVAKINDTAGLNSFIQDVFGHGCALSKKESWANQEGVYRLEIKKTGEKDTKGKELVCATEKVSDILYSPSKNKLMYAYLPEAGMLFSGESESYDEEMIASLRFD